VAGAILVGAVVAGIMAATTLGALVTIVVVACTMRELTEEQVLAALAIIAAPVGAAALLSEWLERPVTPAEVSEVIAGSERLRRISRFCQSVQAPAPPDHPNAAPCGVTSDVRILEKAELRSHFRAGGPSLRRGPPIARILSSKAACRPIGVHQEQARCATLTLSAYAVLGRCLQRPRQQRRGLPFRTPKQS
jgi:hypothetical protein